MKKEYFELEIDVVLLLQEDVLTTSSDADVASDPYGGDNENWWDY